MIRKIGKILSKKQMAIFMLLAVLLFIGGIFDLLGVSIIMPIVNLMMNQETMVNEQWVQLILNVFNIDDVRNLIVLMLVIMIMVYILKNIYIIVMYKALYHFTYRFKEDLASRLINCYMYQDYTFHLNKNVAELQRNILTDAGLFYDFIFSILNLFNQCIVCILLGGYLFLVDWQTAIGALVLLGGAMVCVYVYQKKEQSKRGRANREAAADLNKWIIQSFSGIKEIQVLGREEYFVEKCENAYHRGMEAHKKSCFASVVPKPLMEMISVGGLLSVMLIRILSGADIEQFVSILAAFAVAAFRMLPCFNSISAYISTMLFQKESVNALYNDIIEMESLGEKRIETRKNKRIDLKQDIEISNLSYKYPNTTNYILQNVSFDIKKNQSVGFMGASGAGKSTLIDIILGVLPIEEGKVYVDGEDIYENMSAWHNAIGYIPQSIYLMDGSIRNNVALGVAEGEISDEQLWRALEEAQIADFIRSLPEGLDAEIGDRGVRISGGQRQRLGIARALYHNPQILVFDEATSALDNETEKALMDAINGLKGSRTMLIIAHRLNTIESCDVVYEVKDRKVIKRDI